MKSETSWIDVAIDVAVVASKWFESSEQVKEKTYGKEGTSHRPLWWTVNIAEKLHDILTLSGRKMWCSWGCTWCTRQQQQTIGIIRRESGRRWPRWNGRRGMDSVSVLQWGELVCEKRNERSPSKKVVVALSLSLKTTRPGSFFSRQVWTHFTC